MEKYKIVVGTSKTKRYAQEHYNLITKHDMNANIKILKTDQGELYSVEVGPYSTKKQILPDLDRIKALGVLNAFITNV